LVPLKLLSQQNPKNKRNPTNNLSHSTKHTAGKLSELIEAVVEENRAWFLD
jgi:hypothetical protein